MLNCYFGDDIIIFMKFYIFIKFMLKFVMNIFKYYLCW